MKIILTTMLTLALMACSDSKGAEWAPPIVLKEVRFEAPPECRDKSDPKWAKPSASVQNDPQGMKLKDSTRLVKTNEMSMTKLKGLRRTCAAAIDIYDPPSPVVAKPAKGKPQNGNS